MKVVLAEKPSVARDLARSLQAGAKNEGYFEGNGYQVTWSYGHLAGLQDPEEYDPAWKSWRLETLPILPEEFRLKTLPQRGAGEQFSIIRRLFRDADEIIGATDAGREGELIFRYLLTLSGAENKPCFRVWLNSLTPAAIRQAFQQIRPASDYDNLYSAAKCRSESDWIVGLNATRNYTVRFGGYGQLWSAGRVQTPVLSLLVERDDEIRTFRTEPFWELLTEYRKVKFRFDGERFTREPKAQELLQSVTGQPFVVGKIDRKEERLFPPRLYDLTELQRDMNRRYEMSAALTLKIAQTLYERKLITYPRTDSRYLSSAMKPEVPKVLERLRAEMPKEIGALNLKALPFPSRIVNDRKVADHHAIIPTGNAPKDLAGRERQVFDAVLTRFVAVFYPVCRKEVTVVFGQSAKVPFKARGVRVLEAGWTELYPKPAKKTAANDEHGDSDDQSLPDFQPGESGPHQPEIREGQTKPPPHFTENTLLGAMETAGKLVDDEELQEALKERGLGTPATRASIIETLLKRGYIARKKKNLLATDEGRYLIAVIRDKRLKSAELTGEWEARLRQVEAGRLDADAFMQDIADYTTGIVSREIAAVDERTWGLCPRCGAPIIQGKKGFGCSAWKSGCPFVLWPDYQGGKLADAEIRELLQLGAILEPRESQGNSVVLTLTKSGSVCEVPVPERKPRSKTGNKKRMSPAKKRAKKSTKVLGPCPLCGKNVIESPKAFGCEAWRDGCRFTIWKTIAGKRIGVTIAKTLLARGATRILKGFCSKAGKPFEARLKLDSGEVKLEFDE